MHETGDASNLPLKKPEVIGSCAFVSQDHPVRVRKKGWTVSREPSRIATSLSTYEYGSRGCFLLLPVLYENEVRVQS